MSKKDPSDFWTKFDKYFSKVEKKGFEMANKAHIWGVNLLLAGLAYGTYSIFTDYNDFFKSGRDPNYNIAVAEKDDDGDDQMSMNNLPQRGSSRDRL